MAIFDPFPTLTTARLLLRRIVPTDAEALFQIETEPLVTKYIGRDPFTRAQSEQRLKELDMAIDAGSAIRWAMVPREGAEPVGTCGLWRWDQTHRHAELGYELVPALWGRGYMTEALATVLDYAFPHMNLHRVEANVDPDNHASRRVLEKLGFLHEATLRQNWCHRQVFMDSAIFGLLETDPR